MVDDERKFNFRETGFFPRAVNPLAFKYQPGAQESTRWSDSQGERTPEVDGDDPVHPQKKNRPAVSLTRLLAGLSYILPY